MKVKKVKFDEQVIKIMAAGGATSKDIEKLQEEYDELYNVFPKVTGEGESITLDNTANAPMNIDLKGNGGKNLFSGDYSQFNSTGGTGTTYDYFKLPDDNKQYTLTLIAKNDFTATGSTFFGFTANGGNGGSGVDWVISQGSGTIAKGTILSKTSTNSLRFVSLYSKGSTSLKNFTDNFYIQLEEGNTFTNYQPYGAKVTGDNTIEVIGYNLYNSNDTNAITNGYTIQSDGTLKLNEVDNTGGSSPIFKNFILPLGQFKKNATYTFVLEIVSITGTGHITTNESNTTTQFNAISSLASKTFDSLHAGDIIIGTSTTKEDFANCSRALSSYCYFLAGEKGSITFRLSIIDSTSVTPQTYIYQPYQSASYPINLENTQLNVGDSIEKLTDDWFIVRTDTTTEQITDTTLISQLEALNQVNSCNGQTNISCTYEEGNAPFIIAASALYDLNNLIPTNTRTLSVSLNKMNNKNIDLNAVEEIEKENIEEEATEK